MDDPIILPETMMTAAGWDAIADDEVKTRHVTSSSFVSILIVSMLFTAAAIYLYHHLVNAGG